MKVYNKEIDVVAWFRPDGSIRPKKFRIVKDDGGELVIKVDRLMDRAVQGTKNNICEVFKCKSVIGDIERMYFLKYERYNFKWILFKM